MRRTPRQWSHFFEELEPRRFLSGLTSLTLTGTEGDDVFLAYPGRAILNGVEHLADQITFDGRGGRDTVSLYDSPRDDVFTARPFGAEMIGQGFSVKVTNAEIIHGYAKAGGSDKAQLHDSSGNDTFISKTNWARLYGEDYHLRAKKFEQVTAHASDGIDKASLNDSSGDDVFHSRPDEAALFNADALNRVRGFDYVHGYARFGGYDVAHLYGSAAADWIVGKPDWTKLRGDGFLSRAKFFDEVSVQGEGGQDTAHFYGSSQDKFVQKPEFCRLEGDGFRIRAAQIDDIHKHGIVEADVPVVEERTIELTGPQTLRRGITVESGTTLTGDAVLTRPDRIQAELTSSANPGDELLYVTSTAGFQPGDEWGLFAYGAKSSWIIVAEVGPDWIRTEEPISRTYETADSASLVNYFPLIRATGVVNVTIDGLTLDGNFDLSNRQWKIVGGGLIQFDGVEDSTIRNMTIRNAPATGVLLADGRDNLVENVTITGSRGHGIYLDQETDSTVRNSVSSWNGYQVPGTNGDGILVNGSNNLVIENNLTQHNRRYGLHMGGDLTRGGRWAQNESSYNQSDGFFFCWNNFDTRVEGNTITANEGSGIDGLGPGGDFGDKFNLVTDNIVTGNAEHGIIANGGSDNTIAENDFRGNGLESMSIKGDHLTYGNLVD